MNSTAESSEPQSLTDEAIARELELLETVSENPEIRQTDVAHRLGVAVGTANWLIKRLASKGLIKIKRIGRWQWQYLLTPQGLARKARLTSAYIEHSMSLYREAREQAKRAIREAQDAGCSSIRIDAAKHDEIADVVRLSCLEAGLDVSRDGDAEATLRVDGRRIHLDLPGSAGEGDA